MTSTRRWIVAVPGPGCAGPVGFGLSAEPVVHTDLPRKNPQALDICSVAFGASCDDTLLHSSSWFLKVPLSGWGPRVFTRRWACLLVLAWSLGDAFRQEAMTGALLVGCAAVRRERGL